MPYLPKEVIQKYSTMKTQVKIIELYPKYARTGVMAGLIGRSTRWLKSNKGVLFKQGIHYHQPKGEREPFWDIEAMNKWVRSTETNEEIDLILNKVV